MRQRPNGHEAGFLRDVQKSLVGAGNAVGWVHCYATDHASHQETGQLNVALGQGPCRSKPTLGCVLVFTCQMHNLIHTISPRLMLTWVHTHRYGQGLLG